MKRARKRRLGAGQRGIALLSVLWVGVAIGALASAVVSLSRGDLDLARSQLVHAEAELAADSAVRTAIYALANRADSAIAPDGSVMAWRLPGAEVRLQVTSEHGRIDLNRAPPDLFAAVLQQAGAMPEEAGRLAAATTDFTDPDDSLTPGGAERPDYASAGLPGPKNAPLEHEGELLGVLGMPAGLYRRIADAVTVHSGRPRPRSEQAVPLVRAALEGEPVEAPPPLPPAFSVEFDATPQKIRPGTAGGTSDLVRIRAEAETETGSRAARVAVVSLRLRGGRANAVLAWWHAAPELFPARSPSPLRAASARAGGSR